MPHHVVALALPGVVAFDLSTVAQVFGHPAEEEYTFAVSTPGGDDVMTSSGFSIGAVHGLDALAHADTIIIPGYRPHPRPHESTLKVLRGAHQRGTRVASVCTGVFALAATGLLDGLTATTHWQDAAELQRLYPDITVQPDVLYVDHGQVATSAGVAAGIDLCLHLVRRDFGERAAARIARRMVVPPHRAGGQAQYIEPAAGPTAHGFAELAAWIVDHLGQSLTVADLARQAHLSERQLARRFVAEMGQTPLQWILHQRVLAARHLLENSHLSVDVIAQRTGLGTASTLRRHLRREIDVTPTNYRRTFRAD